MTTFTGYAQPIDEKNFVLYTTIDGLSNNRIYDVKQDAYGYIWIATAKGLNRFDGTKFQQFYADSNKNSLPQDWIRTLRWLDSDRLAVITMNGLHIINTRTLEQKNIIIPSDSLPLLPLNRVMDAFTDKKENIFIATATGFYQFNSKNELLFRYDHFSLNHIQEKKLTAFGLNIIPLEENILLVTTFRKGPYLFYIKEKDFHPVGKNDNAFYQLIGSIEKTVTIPHYDDSSFSSYVQQEEKFLWFDTRRKTVYPVKASFILSENIDGGVNPKLVRLNDTLFAINSKLSGFYVASLNSGTNSFEISSQVYFKDIFCNSFLIDKNKQLWIATNIGLYREKKSASLIQQTKMAPSVKSEIQTLAVSNNKVFIGTHVDGLLVLDTDSLKQIAQLKFDRERKELQHPNFILHAIPVHRDTIYAAIPGVWINTKYLTAGPIPLYHADTTFQHNATDLLFKDSRNNIYIKRGVQNVFYYRRANENTFTLLDYRSKLAKLGPDISGIAEDSEGNIWFSGFGMMRFHYKKQEFDLLLDSFPAIKIRRNGITSNLVFDQSMLYFAVYENGLMIYDQEQKNYSHLTRADGLPDNNILALHLHNGKLWMATESGLACYDLGTRKISSFGTADGIPPYTGHNYILYYDSARHQLYGAFSNTIYRFDPDRLTKNNKPPIFSIESLVIAGKENIYHPAGKIRLSYRQNNVVLNLAAINFEDANEQEFAYRFVKTGNESWMPLGSQRSVIFSDLSAGDHRLQVKVFIRNQSWPDQIREINILVSPPFWKTPWFILLCLAVLLSCLYLFYRMRIKNIKQKANIDKQVTELELKGLHAQMNPHFIFNCLNSIREMILNNENQQASHYLSKFAQLIRITLNQSSKQFITLENTIDYLDRYIEMEKIRNNKFTCTIDVDNELQTEETMIPPMLIQPFLENAIWHGVIPGKELQIRICFKKEGNHLICVVEDNGQGIETSLNNKKEMQVSHQSIGIANVKERIQVLNEKYKLNSELRIEDKSKNGNETGTIVKLYFPLQSIAS